MGRSKLPAQMKTQRPRTRLGAASVSCGVAVVAAIVVLNAVGTQAHHRFDLTANRNNTLTQDTVQVLRQLPQPVTIHGFIQNGTDLGNKLQALLKEYQQAGAGKVHIDFVDPATHPGVARQYGVTQYNEVVVTSGQDHAEVTPADLNDFTASGAPQFNGENALTNAILNAAHPQHLVVYFTQGHGEHDTGGDFSTISRNLSGQGYVVHTLNLLANTRVPADAAAVIIAGPRRDFIDTEVAALHAYARAGGHLVVLLDASPAPLTHLNGLLAELAVTVQNDVVVEPTRHFQSDVFTPIPTYEKQKITDPLDKGGLAVLMPASVSLAVKTTTDFFASPMLKTSAEGWGKTDLHSPQVSFDPKTDIKGPLNLAVIVTSQNVPDFRAVVLGSSTFASDNYLVIQGNRDLFLNSVGWATGRAEGIRIRATAGLKRQVVLTSGSMRGLFYSYVLFLPALALVGAVAVRSWRQRL